MPAKSISSTCMRSENICTERGSIHLPCHNIHYLYPRGGVRTCHWNRVSSVTVPAISTISIRVVQWEHATKTGSAQLLCQQYPQSLSAWYSENMPLKQGQFSYCASVIHNLYPRGTVRTCHWNRFSSITVPALSTISIRVIVWEHLHWRKHVQFTCRATISKSSSRL
jgi:hypothetical protein